MHLFMVYGPGQMDHNKVIPYVVLSLLENQSPKLTSGSRKVDWIYIDDVVDALIACAQVEGIEGQVVEIGSGNLLTVREVVENLSYTISSEAKPNFGALKDREAENVRVADIEKSFALLGWRAVTPLREGLRRTVSWYREQLSNGAFENFRTSEQRGKAEKVEAFK